MGVIQRIIIPIVALGIAFGVARLIKAPRNIIKGAIVAGVVFATVNFLIDLAAIHFSIWHYEMEGLILGTPVDLYLSAGILFGSVTSLVFWWLESKPRYLLYSYLIVLPVLTTMRDYLSARYVYTMLIWDSPYYLVFDFMAWIVLLAITFMVFRFTRAL